MDDYCNTTYIRDGFILRDFNFPSFIQKRKEIFSVKVQDVLGRNRFSRSEYYNNDGRLTDFEFREERRTGTYHIEETIVKDHIQSLKNLKVID